MIFTTLSQINGMDNIFLLMLIGITILATADIAVVVKLITIIPFIFKEGDFFAPRLIFVRLTSLKKGRKINMGELF